MGGKSKSATVGYWYEVAFHSGLGIGPIDAYLEFRGGDKTAWRGEATQSQTIHINAPNLWGGEKDQGGIVGSVDLMFGETGQNPSSRLAGIFGPQQPAWRGFATLAFAGKYGAMNPYPQKASHKIRKIREGWGGECWYPGKAAIPMPTCAGGDPYIHVTSPPYPVYWQDSLGVWATPLRGLVFGWQIESLNSQPATPLGGALKDVKVQYDSWEPESLSSLPATPLGGALKVVVLHYPNYRPESIDTAAAPLGGALT